MVDLLLKGAGDKHADLWLRGATRNGRVPVASRNSVRDIISEWVVDAGSIHGEFPMITSFGNATSSSKDLSIRLKVAIAADGTVTGAWEGGDKQGGAVTGTVRTEAELQKINAFTTKSDWPCWSGPTTSMAATPCGLKIVEDFDRDARLVWRSEELLPPGPGNSLHYEPQILTNRSNGGGSSLIVHDGKVFVNYYQPAGTEYQTEKRSKDTSMGQLERLVKLGQEAKPPVTEITPWMKEKYLAKADDVVVCMDAVTGKTLWKNVFALKSMNQPSHKEGGVNNTPCAGDGRVFAMGPGGCLHGIEIATGKVLWERTGMSSEQVKPWSGARNMCTAPIYAGGTLIMPDHGTALTGIDPATGKDLWKLKDKSYGFQVPAKWMHQGQEYVLSMFQTGGGKGTFSASAACIEPKTGKILWEIVLPPNPSKGVIVHGDTLYVVSGGITTPSEDGAKARCTAFRLDLTRAEQLWQTTTPDANMHPVAACNGRYVVVKGTTKQSHLLDAATGKILATYQGDTGQNECHAAMIEDTVIMSRDGSHGHSDMAILGGTPETFGKLRCVWNQPHPQTTSYHNKYMTWPMVEGRIFMRGFDGVYCYDLRRTE
jgi:outer membrane protein assembly factor BamB